MGKIRLKKDFKIKNIILKNFINLTSSENYDVLRMRNNENIRRYCLSDHIISSKEHDTFIMKLREDNKNFYWVVKQRESLIGVISLNRVDFHNKNAFLGIYSNPGLKGVGDILVMGIKNDKF
ncbi:MAG: UDP-4-amino-4,6-dideoxy-N-acetyl-beta-L-altrosamine N-acetyltransferase [Candidatus Aenigmatarchaeota archaeon]